MECGSNARGPAAPIETDDDELRQVQRVGKIENVLTNCGLLCCFWRIRVEDRVGPVTPQVHRQGAMPRLGHDRRDAVIRVGVVRNPWSMITGTPFCGPLS